MIVFKQIHDSKLAGRLAISSTYKKIKKQCDWKGMKQDVKEYIQNCPRVKRIRSPIGK